MEREYLDATLKYPKRPQVHLALAKFYEYIKLYSRAKESYLKAIDLDSSALESMAGLGRIYHSEGMLEKAYEWIDSCYMGLGKGRLYLAETEKEFRKVVRQKRREFARELGIRPADEPVAIRFQIGADDAEYPKNRPCPCGSGKKYKLCCMKKGSAIDP
jgi:tetratricopeptide (TPR) repeat protein